MSLREEMPGTEATDIQSNLADMRFCAFALSDCVVQLKPESAKYLRAVYRTALELAVPNLFGAEIGGYWLTPDQINQLRKLPECYPATEVALVADAIEAFLLAQTSKLGWLDGSNRGRAAIGAERDPRNHTKQTRI